MKTQEIKEKKSWVKPIFEVEPIKETEGGPAVSYSEDGDYHAS